LTQERQTVKKLQQHIHELEIEQKQLISENRTFIQTSSLFKQEKEELERKNQELISNFEKAKQTLSDSEERNYSLTAQLERMKDQIRFFQQTSKRQNSPTLLTTNNNNSNNSIEEIDLQSDLSQSDQYLLQSSTTSVLESNGMFVSIHSFMFVCFFCSFMFVCFLSLFYFR